MFISRVFLIYLLYFIYCILIDCLFCSLRLDSFCFECSSAIEVKSFWNWQFVWHNWAKNIDTNLSRKKTLVRDKNRYIFECCLIWSCVNFDHSLLKDKHIIFGLYENLSEKNKYKSNSELWSNIRSAFVANKQHSKFKISKRREIQQCRKKNTLVGIGITIFRLFSLHSEISIHSYLYFYCHHIFEHFVVVLY